MAATSATIAMRAAAVAALGAIGLLAACGGEGDEDGTGSGSPTAASTLEVTLDADGPEGELPLREELVCEEGEGGDACALAADLSPAQLEPVPPDTPCTKIYGGPQVATISGVLRGERVDARLTRAGGCEIERFDHVAPLLAELFGDEALMLRPSSTRG